MALPHDVSLVPVPSAHLPGSTAPLRDIGAEAARHEDINQRRARVENPEALRLARAL